LGKEQITEIVYSFIEDKNMCEYLRGKKKKKKVCIFEKNVCAQNPYFVSIMFIDIFMVLP
jgi:hypothetical protein